jgi:hypothetical protein
MLKLIAAALLAVLPAAGHASTVTYQLDNIGQIEIARDAFQTHRTAGWTLAGGPIETFPDHWCIPLEWCEKIDIRVDGFAESSLALFDITVDERFRPVDWGLQMWISTPEGLSVPLYSPGNGNTLTLIPIPPTLALVAGGLGALAWVGRRRRAAIGASPAR